MNEVMKEALIKYGVIISTQGLEAGEELIKRCSVLFTDFERWALAVRTFLRAQRSKGINS